MANYYCDRGLPELDKKYKEDYLKVKEFSKLSGISTRAVARHIQLGHYRGAVLYKHTWYIPKKHLQHKVAV